MKKHLLNFFNISIFKAGSNPKESSVKESELSTKYLTTLSKLLQKDNLFMLTIPSQHIHAYPYISPGNEDEEISLESSSPTDTTDI